MKKITIIWIVLLFLTAFANSCSDTENKYQKYRYIIKTTHDKNWTSSAVIRCDSLNMINQMEAELFIDGRNMYLTAPQIRIYDNPYYDNKPNIDK